MTAGLLLGSYGCAQPAPTPAPAPTVTVTAPAPTPKPAPTVTVTAPPTPTKPAEKTRVQFIAGRPGDVFTVLSYALSGFINEDSEVLKSSVLTTGGTADYLKIIKEEPAKKAVSIGIMETGTITAFGKPDGLNPKFLGMIQSIPYLWATYNKDIKTLKDFAGHSVAGPRAVAGWQENFIVPLELAGVKDQIKLTATGMGAAAQALMDGAVDIAYADLTYIPPSTIKLGTALEQAKVKGALYFPDWGKETIEVGLAGRVAWKPILALQVPPKALGETQPDTIYVWLLPLFWAATPDMPNNVAYEIARVLYERAKKGDFAGFHAQGAGIVPGFVELGPWKTKADIEEWYHPGALKFYRDIGVKGL
ncbi:MAG: hypothetical protein HY530_01925 [Chloroflexi bacterium]|nr:hypothetical protein [Chloroflexota bacterium]